MRRDMTTRRENRSCRQKLWLTSLRELATKWESLNWAYGNSLVTLSPTTTLISLTCLFTLHDSALTSLCHGVLDGYWSDAGDIPSEEFHMVLFSVFPCEWTFQWCRCGILVLAVPPSLSRTVKTIIFSFSLFSFHHHGSCLLRLLSPTSKLLC